VTRQFVDAVAGSRADILDTRKTIPGWRVLQKYAVRMGGGVNHRMGLYDEVMIKDNHLAGWSAFEPGASIAGIVRHARERAAGVPIEVEVDTLAQLEDGLKGQPDVVLLDNMTPPMLREAVKIRDRLAPHVKLEASGSVTLRNVAQVAAAGVDRISIGALTHSAVALDIAFDWYSAPV
jgi:nicotinate-nucleotide pyrophosphorylase (carboxylating)